MKDLESERLFSFYHTKGRAEDARLLFYEPGWPNNHVLLHPDETTTLGTPICGSDCFDPKNEGEDMEFYGVVFVKNDIKPYLLYCILMLFTISILAAMSIVFI